MPDWFPGAGFKRLARIAKARGEHMVDGAFDAAKEAMNGDDSIPSLVGSLLSREGPKEMTRDEYEYTIKWAAGSLYGGAYLRTPSSSSLLGHAPRTHNSAFSLSPAGTESVSSIADL